MLWPFAYVASVVFVNWSFTHLPMLHTPWGDIWSPASLIVGAVFSIRDFAQRDIGHKVILATILGIVLSYLMADPFVAMASAAAFGVGEMADWAVYSLTSSRPFRQRILFSNLVGVPLDTAVFLLGIGAISWTGWGVMTLSKFVALVALTWTKHEAPSIKTA